MRVVPVAAAAGALVLRHSSPDGRWLTAAEVEREHIVRTLQVAGNNQSLAARLLGIDLNVLRRRMISHGLTLSAAGQDRPALRIYGSSDAA